MAELSITDMTIMAKIIMATAGQEAWVVMNLAWVLGGHMEAVAEVVLVGAK